MQNSLFRWISISTTDFDKAGQDIKLKTRDDRPWFLDNKWLECIQYNAGHIMGLRSAAVTHNLAQSLVAHDLNAGLYSQLTLTLT